MQTLIREIRKKWKPRKPDSHKGDFGRVFILAGSKNYTGAAHLAAQGALRSGAGLITLAVPQTVYPILARKENEVMVQAFPATRDGGFALRGRAPILKQLKLQDVFAVGPGLGRHPETQRLVRHLVLQAGLPVVLDADGLNAFVGKQALLKKIKSPAILTPHPGEFKRLFGGVLSHQESVRRQRALETAKKYKVFLILKGHHTVAASPSGKIYVNHTGNPGMATGGTGDVLTGMIAAFLGQGFEIWDALRFALFFHGLAGDLAAKKLGEASLAAGDLLIYLPKAIKGIRN